MPQPSKTTVRQELLQWFDANKRELPWRGVNDPYKTWLSEILMQQTRVAQGLPYYLKFVERFPTVQALAAASEQEVLKLWQGLGYYSRARNLHNTAKAIVEKHKGIFPVSYEEVISLKGIGSYTAAAILSISFNKPFAVLDGNVYRVLSRLHALEMPINAPGAEKEYSALAQDLLDKQQPGKFNEAMMELGALICTPQSPACSICPLNNECEAFRLGEVNELPVKIKAKKATQRDINYLFSHNSEGLYLKKRHEGDIWQGMYDMPEVDGQPHDATLLKQHKHILSHRVLHISFYDKAAELPKGAKIKDSKPKTTTLAAEPPSLYKNNNTAQTGLIFVPFSHLDEYPLPRPIELFLNEYLKNNEIC
jgi:A/G-specific adenine glycosylase